MLFKCMYSICSFFYATFICNALLISLETQISGKKEKKPNPILPPQPAPPQNQVFWTQVCGRWERCSHCRWDWTIQVMLFIYSPLQFSPLVVSTTWDGRIWGTWESQEDKSGIYPGVEEFVLGIQMDSRKFVFPADPLASPPVRSPKTEGK